MITALAVCLAVAKKIGFLDRDGIWDVTVVVADDSGCWEGWDINGQPMGGPLTKYVATCVDGDRTREVILACAFTGPAETVELPVQVGDRIRFVTDSSVENSRELYDGTLVVVQE
ncbi:MAG: hypothetical protein AAGG48_25630 [Planctomycetota bacterium]